MSMAINSFQPINWANFHQEPAQRGQAVETTKLFALQDVENTSSLSTNEAKVTQQPDQRRPAADFIGMFFDHYA